MEIKITDQTEQESFYPEVLALLEQADGDFVPPLSARSSSTQKDLSESTVRSSGVLEYFTQLKSQRFAVVTEQGRLIAFVSWRENYTCGQISPDTFPNIYITTLIVRPEARGRGVTTALYQALFAHYADRHIFTRTWSTNAAHIRVLEKYGFSVTAVLKDHRGPGIHTVYFQKSPVSSRD